MKFKGIVSDSNIIFLWPESEDMNKKVFHLQVMHDYVQFYCSIDYSVKLILVDQT